MLWFWWETGGGEGEEEDFLSGGCEREALYFARFLGMYVGALRSSVSSSSSHLDRFLVRVYRFWLLSSVDIVV